VIFNLPAGPNTATLANSGGNLLLSSSPVTFEMTTFANPTNALTINAGGTADTLAITGPSNLTAGLTAGSNATPFAAIAVSGTFTLSTGTAALALTASSISDTSGTQTAGSVNLTGTGTVAGNSVGININGATVQSSTGNVQLQGTGGNTGNNNFGVEIQGGGKVTSTSATGTVMVQGTGGASSGNSNFGVLLTGAGAQITSTGGNVSVTGQAGGSATTVGIEIDAGNSVTAPGAHSVTLTGTGAGTGDISIGGTVSSTSGAVNATSSGLLSETGTGKITTSGTLTTSSATGTTLSGAGTNAVGTFNATNTTSGNISLDNTIATLTVSGLSEVTGGTATIHNTGAVTFSSALSGGFNLNDTSTGLSTFGAAVGSPTPLASVTVANTAALNGGSVTTTGAQAFNGAVTLGANTTLASTGAGNVTFASTVNGAFGLTVNTAGVTTFGGAVGGATALTSLTTDAPGSTAINGGSVTTTGAQAFNDAVTLGANTTLTSTGAGNITLGGAVNGTFALTVNTAGVTTFGGPVGNLAPLNQLTTDAPGSTDLNGGTVLTFGGQFYNDAVVLSANTTLTSASPGAITLASTVNGAFSLTVNTSGVTTFGGAVGGTTPLTTLTTDAPGVTQINGGAVTTTSNQTYNDNVTLGVSTALNAGSGNVTFGGTLNGTTAGAQNLSITTTGSVLFSGAVGATRLGTLTLTNVANVTANSTLSATSIVETGGTGTATFNGAVDTTAAAGINLSTPTIVLNANMSAPGGSVTFNATGASPAAFGVNQTAGALTAASLALTGTGTFTINDATNHVGGLTANVYGPLTYRDSGALNAGPVIDTGTAANGAVTLNTGNTLTLGGALTGTAVTLNVTTGGVNQTAGPLTATTLLLTSGAAATGNFTLNQPGNNVGTLAAQVVTGAGGSLSYTGTGGGGNLIVGTLGAVNGIHTGNAATPGGNVSLTTSGTITVNQPIDTTSGAGGSLIASGSVALNASVNLGAGNITLQGGPNGDLLINAPQTAATTITFFSSRDIIVAAPVTTTAAGASINVSADNDGLGNGDGVGGVRVLPTGRLVSAANVLAEGSDLFATPAGTPDSVRIDPNGLNVQISAAGNIVIRQRLIPQVPAGAHTFLNGVIQSTGAGAVTLSGQQAVELSVPVSSAGGPITFEHVTTGAPTPTAVLLTGDSTVSAGAGNVLFLGTIDGGFNLTVNSSGVTTFAGAVGGTTPLASLTTDAPGSTDLNGGSVTTTGAQTYNDPVLLSTDTVLTSTASGNVTFTLTVNGAFNLTVNTAGVTTFGGAVGGAMALTSVTTDAPGSTDLNGGTVTTTGAQIYKDAVLLSANTTLISTGAGAVTLASTVNGAFNLTVNTAGVTTFGGAVGGTTALTSVTTDAPGSTDLNGGSVVTTTFQSYGDPVLLSANTTLTSTGAGNITFVSTVNGAFSLTVNTAGVTGFGGAVGGTAPLASLTTDAPGITDLNGGLVVTVGDQFYGDAVILTANTVINGHNITFASKLDSDAVTARDLTLTATGNIGFTGKAGAAHRLGSVTINNAVNVTNSDTFSATRLVQVAGSGTTRINGALDVSGAAGADLAGIDLTTNTIILNANVSATAANAVVRFNPAAGGNPAAVGVNQTAGTLSTPNLLLNGTGVFLLDRPTNVIGTLAAAVNGTVSARDAGAILIGTVLTTNGVTTTNGDFDLNSLGPISIAQAVNTGAGTVRLASGGAVGQSGAGTITTTAGLGVRAGGAINLPLAGNQVGTFAAVSSGANQPIIFDATGGFTVGTVSAEATSGFTQTAGVTTVNGNVTLVATGLLTLGDGNGQGITAGGATVDLNAAGVTENAGSVVAAANLRLQGAGTFTLTQGNVVGTLAAAVAGPLSYNNVNALTVGTVLGTPGINTNGNNLTLTVGGLLTIGTGAGQPITAAGATVDITAAGVTENANSAITAANLRLQGTGTFSLTQGNAVGTLAAATAGPLAFNNVGALTVGTVLGTAGITSGNSNVNLRTQAGGLTLANAITAGLATVTLNAAGSITQAAAAPITAGSLGILAAGAVDLCSAGAANNVAVLAANDSAAGAPILFGDTTGLTVAAVPAAALFPGAAGVTTAGNGNITLEEMASNLALANAVTAGAGTVALSSAGNITQAAAGAVTAGSLGLLAGAVIDLLSAGAPNQVTTLAATGTNISFNDAAHVTIGAVPAFTCFAGAAGVHAPGGTVDLQAAGADETATDFLTAANLRLRGAGTFALTNDSNNVDMLAAATTGPVNYHDANDLVVGTVLGTPGINNGGQGGVTLSAGQGAFLLTLAQSITATQTAPAPGAIVDLLAGSAAENAGAIINAANLRLQSRLPNGAFTLTQNNQVGTLASATAGVLTFTNAKLLTVGTVLGTAGITTGGGAGSVPTGSSVSSTVGVFDPATATWSLRNDNSAGGPGFTPFKFGAPGWIPVVGDWTGSGTVSVGVVDPATMTWYLRNSNSAGPPSFTAFKFGMPGWIPVVGDWDGNGTTTVGAVDPKTMTWYLRNSNSAGAPDIAPFRFGAPGWTPVVGDWDGNHTTTVGAVDPATMTWFLRNSNSAGAPSITPFAFGTPGFKPVVGDWDGNGTTTVGAFDPATSTWYQRNSNSPGAPDNPPFAFGGPNVVPVAGDWLPSKPPLRRTASVTSGGSNVSLVTAGPLVVGTGAGEGIVAGGATVDLFTAGVLERANSAVSTTNLRLQGNGWFLLQQGNHLATLAANTSGGPVAVTDLDGLTVGTVNGTNGVTVKNDPLTLVTAQSLNVTQPVTTSTGAKAAAADTSFWITTGTNLTFNAAVNTGPSAVVAQSGSATQPVTVTVNNRVTALSANFTGGDQPDSTRGDTFNITPSDTTQFWVFAKGPGVLPGDSIFINNLTGARDGLPNAKVTAFNIQNQVGGSKDGFFAFDARQFVHFSGIESVTQVTVQVSSAQLDANGNFKILATGSFGSTQFGSAVNINNTTTPPFFLAPNFTNPMPPFSTPTSAVGDVNGDGIGDVIVGLGAGNQPLVTVIDGTAVLRIANGGAPLDPAVDVMTQFFAFDPTFRGGVFVAAGDIENSGRADIVVGAGSGPLPGSDPNALKHVRTFQNTLPTGAMQATLDGTNRMHTAVSMQQLPGPLGAFDAYNPAFGGGVRVAVGDVNGDGHADIITAPGAGAEPRINVYSGLDGSALHSFLAFDPAYQGGLSIAAGNYQASSNIADILVGPNAGASPVVKVFRGNDLALLVPDFLAFHPLPVQQMPGSPAALTGVSGLAFGGREQNGLLDILVGVGSGGLGENNGVAALGFVFSGNNGYGPDAASSALLFSFFNNNQSNTPLLNGIEFAGVVTGQA
jgi:hypothetical protein